MKRAVLLMLLLSIITERALGLTLWQPDPTECAHNSHNAANGWTPKPTPAAFLRVLGAVNRQGLFGRQDAGTSNTCGYISKDPASPITCNSGSTCGYLYSNTPVDLFGCYSSGATAFTSIVATCLDYTATGNTWGGSGATYVASISALLCGSAAQNCAVTALAQTQFIYTTFNCWTGGSGTTVLADQDSSVGTGTYITTTPVTVTSVQTPTPSTVTTVLSPSPTSSPTDSPTSSPDTTTPTDQATTDTLTNLTASSPSTSPDPIPSSPASETTSAVPPPKPTHTAAIAGGVVGGVVALALVALIAYLVLKKKRERLPPMREVSQYTVSPRT